MAEVSDDFLRFTPSSLPSLCMDSAMESIAQFEELNAYVLDTPLFNLHGVMDFSNDTIHQPKFPDNLLGFPATNDQNLVPVSLSMACMGDGNQESETMKKATGIEEGDKTMRKNSFLRRKKRKCDEKQQEIPKGVVHVRARRGQATDSHSLAERVRREKINERMRCLQDLVPGCYKTKGMALMLDEIINYVHSLQNQVEFLSMKLSAASSFYDFSSDMEFTETRQADQHHNFIRL